MDSKNSTNPMAQEAKEELLRRISAVFADLYKAIYSFEEKDFNKIPFQGSWTAGQVCGHVVKAVSFAPQLCRGRTESSNRPFDEKVPDFEGIFLDFSLKFESPDFIRPSDGPHSRAEQLIVFKKTETAFIELVERQDLSLLCLDFELPGSGLLTRYEWLRFALVHTQRHTHQLKNISNHLKQHKQ